MPDEPDILDIVLACPETNGSTVLGVKQVCNYVGVRVSREMLNTLIAEVEEHLATVKRRISQ